MVSLVITDWNTGQDKAIGSVCLSVCLFPLLSFEPYGSLYALYHRAGRNNAAIHLSVLPIVYDAAF